MKCRGCGNQLGCKLVHHVSMVINLLPSPTIEKVVSQVCNTSLTMFLESILHLQFLHLNVFFCIGMYMCVQFLFCNLVNYPYRNDKVVTRLWSPRNLVTTLLQPCHNLATTLSRPCSIFTIPLQPCNHIVYSFTRLSQACHKLATTLS